MVGLGSTGAIVGVVTVEIMGVGMQFGSEAAAAGAGGPPKRGTNSAAFGFRIDEFWPFMFKILISNLDLIEVLI